MRLHKNAGHRGSVVDLDTNERVREVVWIEIADADMEKVRSRLPVDSTEIETYLLGPDGKAIPKLLPTGVVFKTARWRGRFRYFPRLEKLSQPGLPPKTPKVILGAPVCARCPSTLTLPGDDLCPACRAHDRRQKHGMQRAGRLDPFQRFACSHFGCGRLAAWSVSDEVGVSPQQRGKLLFDRGATVGRRYYCSRHYVPPRILDAKGEVMEVLEEAGGCRPQ